MMEKCKSQHFNPFDYMCFIPYDLICLIRVGKITALEDTECYGVCVKKRYKIWGVQLNAWVKA